MVVVVVTVIGKRHSMGQTVVVCKDEFHRSRLVDGRPRPAPDVSPIGCGTNLFAEVSILIAVQVIATIFCTYFAIDRLIPAESWQLEVGGIVSVNDFDAVRRIGWSSVVRSFGCRQRLGFGIGKYRQS